MSFGLITDKSEILFPSTKIKGLLSPFVETPLILMFSPLPGEPELEVIFTPDTCPCKACSILVGFNFAIDLASTTDTAPVDSFLR